MITATTAPSERKTIPTALPADGDRTPEVPQRTSPRIIATLTRTSRAAKRSIIKKAAPIMSSGVPFLRTKNAIAIPRPHRPIRPASTMLPALTSRFTSVSISAARIWNPRCGLSTSARQCGHIKVLSVICSDTWRRVEQWGQVVIWLMMLTRVICQSWAST